MGGDNNPKKPECCDDEAILDHARTTVQHLAEHREEMANKAGTEIGAYDSFDFGNKGISSLPEELADIIKDHASRLALDRNWLSSLSGLAPRISEFHRLKYLVVRYNELDEFPATVLTLSNLEYLDLRANKIASLPEDLSRLKSIKVICVKNNKITRLPLCIGAMASLQFMVLDKNPIQFPEKKLWRWTHRIPDSDDNGERSRQIEETGRVRKILQQYLSESVAETPRAYKRRPGGRFPIKPSINGINLDDPTDNTSTDVSGPQSALVLPKTLGGLPPTPRSAAIRPGIGPLMNNDRHRSNSESLMSTSVRKKRMGIQMSRGGKGSAEGIDIEALTSDAERTNHNRGASVGPVLLNNGTANGGIVTDSSSPASPTQQDTRDPYYSRLSSLPENKRKSQHHDPVIELAQDIHFSLEQVEGSVRTVVHASKSSGPKRRALERSFQAFTTNKTELSQALADQGSYDEENDSAPKGDRRGSADWVSGCCGQCLDSFQKLSESLDAHLPLIVEHVDPRYVRLLMHMLYASTIEIRNAYGRICITSEIGPPQIPPKAPTTSIDSTKSRVASPSPRPTTSLRIRDPRRVRNGSGPIDRNKPLPSPRLTNGGSKSARMPSYAQRTQDIYNTITPSLTPSSSYMSEASLTDYDETEEEEKFEVLFGKLKVAADSALQTLPQCSNILHETKRSNVEGYNVNGYSSSSEPYDLLLHQCGTANDAAVDLKTRLKTLKVGESRPMDSMGFWQLCTSVIRAYSTFATSVRSQSQLVQIPEDLKMIMRPCHRAIRSASHAIQHSPWQQYAVHGPNSGTPTMGGHGSSIFSFPSSTPTAHSSTFSTSTDYTSSPSSNFMSTPRTSQASSFSQSYAIHSHQPPNLVLNTSFGSNNSLDSGPPTASLTNSFNSYNSGHGSHINGSGTGSGWTTPLPATPISAALGPAAQATIDTNGQGHNGLGLGLHTSNGNGALGPTHSAAGIANGQMATTNGTSAHEATIANASGMPAWYSSALEGSISRSTSSAGTNGLGVSRSATTSRSVSRSVSQRRLPG